MIGAYKIELNGKCYVGSSINLHKRQVEHYWRLKKGIHPNKHLQNAYNKYGAEKLVYSILEVTENAGEVVAIEQKYIDKLNPEYNIRLIAESNYGFRHTEETKQKMSKSGKGNPHYGARGLKRSEDSKKKTRDALIGRKRSEETKRKMRKPHKGAIGHKLSEETKKKISNARMGMVVSEETCQKIREFNIGKTFSEETKAKIKKAATGRKHLEETKKKMSEAAKKRSNTTAFKTLVIERNLRLGIVPPSRKGVKRTEEQKRITREKRKEKNEQIKKQASTL